MSGDGRVVLEDSDDGSTPVDLPLSLVLADMPRKTFASRRAARVTTPLVLPASADVASALDRLLRLPSVGSKRFLTNKVDRSVTGLIAQQQCVGPFHTPLADCGVIAHTHTDVAGAATAVGEQPIKGLLDPAAMARLSVAESLTNLVWAPVTALGDVKCSANWMWAAKLEGEGAAMWDACEGMCDMMCSMGVSIDGGKDSLSMAAKVEGEAVKRPLAPTPALAPIPNPHPSPRSNPNPNPTPYLAPTPNPHLNPKVEGETVKAPGALVITTYAACPDVRLTVTPDLKSANGLLYLIDLSGGRRRLGGTALAQGGWEPRRGMWPPIGWRCSRPGRVEPRRGMWAPIGWRCSRPGRLGAA